MFPFGDPIYVDNALKNADNVDGHQIFAWKHSDRGQHYFYRLLWLND